MTALVWFRRDLRVHDHPALASALRDHVRVVPVFVFDSRLIHGRFPSPGRTQFLLESLADLRESLRERGGDLVMRHGRPEDVLPALACEVGASALYFASDVSPFAMERDRRVQRALRSAGIEVHRRPGNFVADVGRPQTADGRPYSVYSPFRRAWEELPRRGLEPAPERLRTPAGFAFGELPALGDLGLEGELPEPMPGGEHAARRRLEEWLAGGIDAYHERHGRLDGGTSELSPYIHFGCLSVRELEQSARDRGGPGPAAYVRQLAWRDFYAHVLLRHPRNARSSFKPEYDALQWDSDDERLAAWKEGRTGYPVVDAGMRELAHRGWMHNRARLIVASFLSKDLHLDWRAGEAWFMRMLLCGDEAQNNGNWQWIASVGVDPQPFQRRLYNPVLQQRRHDPEGRYVRRWVPELRGVPLERLAEPWRMTGEQQEAAACVIGRDYPAPVVEHQVERRVAIERYRAVGGG